MALPIRNLSLRYEGGQSGPQPKLPFSARSSYDRNGSVTGNVSGRLAEWLSDFPTGRKRHEAVFKRFLMKSTRVLSNIRYSVGFLHCD